MIEFIFSRQFLSSSISYALPIAFAALAALISKKANIVSINIEGAMSVSALTGALVSSFSGSWLLGLICAILAGVAMSMILAFSALKLGTDSFLSGIALNTFASGACILIMYIVLGVKGDTSAAPSAMLPRITVPVLSRLPVIGILFDQNILFYIAILSLAGITFLLRRTKLGVAIRATGFHAEAAESVGIKTKQIKTIALIFCGAFCGLGGAYLSMASLGYFSAGMVSGRGFIGIAAEAMGMGVSWLCMVFSFLFGAVDYFAVGSQTVLSAPYELLNTLPYIMTMIALTVYAVTAKKCANRKKE